MNLLLIGNSFSLNVSRYLPQLAQEGGHPLHIGRAEVGGCSLQRHWQHVEAAQRDEAEGRFYLQRSQQGEIVPDGARYSLHELLGQRDWDVVSFHQASLPSSDPASYRPYARLLYDLIQDACPRAEIVLHQTWAYRSDSPIWGEIGQGQSASSQREMWEKSRAAYYTIAQELGVRVVPTGDAFWRVDSDPQWHYRPDRRFDFAHPLFPHLPNQTHSLHGGYYWNEEGKLSLDAKHTSVAGAYLGALVWYGFLFGASPQSVTFAPPAVEADFAAHLRAVASQTLQECGRN